MRLVTKKLKVVFTALLLVSLATLTACGDGIHSGEPVSQDETTPGQGSSLQLPVEIKMEVEEDSPTQSNELTITYEATALANLSGVTLRFELKGPVSVEGGSQIELGRLKENETQRFTRRLQLQGKGEALLKGALELTIDKFDYTGTVKRDISFLVSPSKTYFSRWSFQHARVDSLKDVYGISDDSTGVSLQNVSPQKRRAYERAVDELSTYRGKSEIIRHDSSKKNEVGAAAATLAIEGTARYEDVNGNPHPIRHAIVKIREEDVLVDDVLATTTTDASGHYSATVSGGDLIGEAEVYVQVLARSQGAGVAPPGGDRRRRSFAGVFVTGWKKAHKMSVKL